MFKIHFRFELGVIDSQLLYIGCSDTSHEAKEISQNISTFNTTEMHHWYRGGHRGVTKPMDVDSIH